MKIKFWLFAALFAAAAMTTATSCKDDDPGKEQPPVGPVEPDTKEPTAADMKYINNTMDAYMKTHYLWNDAYKKISTPSFDQDSKAFLSSALNAVKAQNDINHDDGYTASNGNFYFYSYINYSPLTKSNTRVEMGETQTFGFGFTGIRIGLVDGGYYFGILGVTPNSPAAKAGITRAMFISKVDGVTITEKNYAELYDKLFPTTGVSTKFSMISMTRDENGVVAKKNLEPATLQATSYEADPIIFSVLVQSRENEDLRIGYIAYTEFNAPFDERLINTFQSLKQAANQEGGDLTDLIIDLRYNVGGYLKSSVMLATLIAGEKYKDQLFCKTTYNEERNKTEQPGEYFIGNKKISQLEGGSYDMIETALAASVNMERVYILTSNNTASASELFIVGLQGILGEENVRVIGDVTNGKNVGMEGQSFDYNGFAYNFYPITFRLENGKGFSDYGEGIIPDVKFENPDGTYMLSNYATGSEILFGTAYTWITTGEKPTESVAAKAPGIVSVTPVGEARLAKPLVEGTIIRNVIKK